MNRKSLLLLGHWDEGFDEGISIDSAKLLQRLLVA